MEFYDMLMHRLTKTEAFERLLEGGSVYVRNAEGNWELLRLAADETNSGYLEALRKL